MAEKKIPKQKLTDLEMKAKYKAKGGVTRVIMNPDKYTSDTGHKMFGSGNRNG